MMLAPTRPRIEGLLEQSGRVAPREVLEAYEATGLEPITGDFYHGSGACALGAVARHNGVDPNDPTWDVPEFIDRRSGIRGFGYALSFAAAFDGCSDWWADNRITNRIGFYDGRRAYAAVQSRYPGALDD